jgi:hypothetical protein
VEESGSGGVNSVLSFEKQAVIAAVERPWSWILAQLAQLP